VFWVISVYFNIRNTLPKSGTFLLGHPVYFAYLFLQLYDTHLADYELLVFIQGTNTADCGIDDCDSDDHDHDEEYDDGSATSVPFSPSLYLCSKWRE